MKHTRRFVLVVAAVAAAAAPASNGQTLRGSRASVDLMYNRAHAVGLQFFNTPREVATAATAGELRLISITNDVVLDRVYYPFVLPRTLDLINAIAAEYHATCGERLVVTSGTRPTDGQPRNASPESVHPTGMAVDFRLPNGPCRTWLRDRLVALEKQGVIEATEERHPPHFHVALLATSHAQYASQARRGTPVVSSSAGEVAPPTPVQEKRSRSR